MATGRRKVLDHDDAEQLLDEWEASGLEFRAFCAQSGVDGRSLQCWRKNLGRRQMGAPLPHLVELVRGGRPPKAAPTYRVVVGDVAVEVGDGFRDDTLARLLAVVAGC